MGINPKPLVAPSRGLLCGCETSYLLREVSFSALVLFQVSDDCCIQGLPAVSLTSTTQTNKVLIDWSRLIVNKE